MPLVQLWLGARVNNLFGRMLADGNFLTSQPTDYPGNSHISRGCQRRIVHFTMS